MPVNRRDLFRWSAMLSAGGQALWHNEDIAAAVAEANDASSGIPWPQMQYRKLGRTGFNASRLVFGCGAALSKKRQDRLLNQALDTGVNVFDVGTRRYYDNAESNLAPFIAQQLASRRDRTFLISKAMVYLDVEAEDVISTAQAKQAAITWAKLLNESLQELGVDHVDAYYQMAANNVSVVGAEEMKRAFDDAKAAGKVTYLGLSTHQNAHAVLEKAIETGWYDLAMIAITPAGWYDWNNRNIMDNTPSMADLQPLLGRAREAGIGLIGMKAARLLAGRSWLGRGNQEAFNRFYSKPLLASQLSHFQRSYAYVLEHGLDAVNADIQNFAILKENYIAAAQSHRFVHGTADETAGTA